MKKVLLLTAIVGIVLAGCSSSDEPGGGGMEKPALTVAENEATSEINEFALDFIVAVNDNMEEDDENFVVSPLSMSMYLAMTANAGDKDAICKALHCSNLEALNSMSEKYMKWLPNSNKKLKINIVNALWYDENYSVNPNFADAAQSFFDCDIFARDFGDSNLKDEINGWASKNTNGMIKELVEENPNSLLLANALYFNGEWANPFNAKNTVKADFHGIKGTATVDMMKKSLTAEYFEDDNLQAVRLPFVKNFSAIILMPRGETDINTFIKDDLDGFWTVKGVSNLFRQYNIVDLSFPKFEVKPGTRRMNGVLADIGIPNTNVNILAGEERPLDVFQIATVRFDEKGAEAAAVTVGGEISPGPMENVTMTVDRPFLFFINEDSTGLCLFAGKVVNL